MSRFSEHDDKANEFDMVITEFMDRMYFHFSP